MACKAHCVCKCGNTGCECWDGIQITKRDLEQLEAEPAPKTTSGTDKS